MYHYTLPVSNKNIVEIIKRAFNLVDKRLIGHGTRVSSIVFRMMEVSDDYTPLEKRDLLILAALHDIGAYKTDEIDKMVEFETKNIWRHSIYGYMFFKYFTPFRESAPAILYHHSPWAKLKDLEQVTPSMKRAAQLIHLADRLDIYFSFSRKDKIDYKSFISTLDKNCPGIFNQEVTDLFKQADFSKLFESASGDPSVAQTDMFLTEQLEREFYKVLEIVPFTEDERNGLLQMLTYAIDFRSPHTVTHTITTTVISGELADIFCDNEQDINDVVCGAMLHDLGKIGIPTEILEFPGKLSPQSMNVMRTHVDLTEMILENYVTQKVKDIALRHHEKLDGSGYPRGLKADVLTMQQRIVAIADVVSALSGTRSYKDSFSKDKTCAILSDMSRRGLVDAVIVERILENYDSIMETVMEKAAPILKIYQEMQNGYVDMLQSLTT